MCVYKRLNHRNHTHTDKNERVRLWEVPLSLSTLPWGLLMQFPRCVWLAAVSMAVPKDCGGVWCQVWCHVSLYCSHSKASLTIVLCVCVEALCVCVGFRSAQTHKASNPQSKSSPITAVALLTSCGDMKLNTCAVQSESALNTRVRSPLPVLRPSPLLSWFLSLRRVESEQTGGQPLLNLPFLRQTPCCGG